MPFVSPVRVCSVLGAMLLAADGGTVALAQAPSSQPRVTLPPVIVTAPKEPTDVKECRAA